MQTQTARPPAEADPAAEVFDIVDESGNVIGSEARAVVHKLGLLHRAVYVFVFDTRGRLLIQRRSAAKKIGPGQWDLSVAEHLSQGETFHQAACRGLQEELGICTAVVPHEPLSPTHKRTLVVPGQYVDAELVQAYRVDGFEGQIDQSSSRLGTEDVDCICDAAVVLPAPQQEVQWNAAEVSAVKFIELDDLRAQVAAEPDAFTQWFRDELELLGYFQQQQQLAAAELN